MLITLTLTSCSAPDPADPAPSTATAAEDPAGGSAEPPLGDGHGAIDGAAEVAEPQLHLITLDPAGSVELLDLADETRTTLGEVPGTTATSTDGRYLFASSAEGTLTVIDSGVWTWDHEDHFHYYRAEPRIVGTVEGDGEAVVTPGDSGTGVFFPDSGEGMILDKDALGKGEISTVTQVSTDPHTGMFVPLPGSLQLLTGAGPDGTGDTVQAYDADGRAVPDASAECVDAQGTITTRVGTVIGCDDGALLATVSNGDVEFERIAYPAGIAVDRATGFSARKGRPTVAAVAGDQGLWLLDTRQREWQFLATEQPLRRVTAVDDREGHVVALTDAGTVLVLSSGTGETIGETEPLLEETIADPTLLDGVELVTDQQRSYLNAPAEQQLYEIDFADDARIARTFPTDDAPVFFTETGR
ncbi:hypothetical protein AC792_14895 [Arthrobacter sp. RIT-PI-e]|nr:hypothetical protein AC792_14895 [Arthrobacter sp. RIT-PI-e]